MNLEPSAAILIDCWQCDDAPRYTTQDVSILSFIENMDCIVTVILATYNAFLEHMNSQTIWYGNSRALVGGHIISVNVPQFENTNPLILNYVNPKKFQIALTEMWQLEKYLELNPHIKNLFVFGRAWDNCVKLRPLGYDNLSKINSINVLTNAYCVSTMDGSCPDLSTDPKWYHLDNNIWMLKR